jgi:hypothetical protein
LYLQESINIVLIRYSECCAFHTTPSYYYHWLQSSVITQPLKLVVASAQGPVIYRFASLGETTIMAVKGSEVCALPINHKYLNNPFCFSLPLSLSILIILANGLYIYNTSGGPASSKYVFIKSQSWASSRRCDLQKPWLWFPEYTMLQGRFCRFSKGEHSKKIQGLTIHQIVWLIIEK